MPPVMCRCGILALVLILAVGNSAGIQAIAWVSMIVDRAQTESVGEAITSTFSGTKPCALCKVAKALASAETDALPNHATGKAPQKQHVPPMLKWTMDEPWQSTNGSDGDQGIRWPTLYRVAFSYVSTPPTPPPLA